MIEPLLRLGRRDDALDACEEAIALAQAAGPVGSLGAVLWSRKGQVLRRMNRHEEAIQAYDHALRLDQHNPWASYGKGGALAAIGRFAEALACFEAAAALRPNAAWFRYAVGETLIDLGRYDAAIETLNRVLALRPDHHQARLKREEARKKREKAG